MDAIIISVGTELVTGQCMDTNSAWLSARLAEQGVTTLEHQTIGDDVQRLAAAIRRAQDAAEMVLITGGLGPTLDDITRDAISVALGAPLAEDPASVAHIEGFFRRLNRPMSESNRRQALLPRGCRTIHNPRGTAPGIYYEHAPSLAPMHPETGRGAAAPGWRASRQLWALPGVPSEMRAMFEQAIAPTLDRARAAVHRDAGRAICVRRLNCFGVTEAGLGEQIADLMARGRNPNVGTTASDAVLSVRIVAEGDSPAEAQRLAELDAADVRARLGWAVFGQDDETLQSAVAGLLIARGKTIATAESCTGGLLADRLTEISGSSAYFLRGFVTYSDAAKIAELGLPPDLIRVQGAVSEQVACAMAAGCRAVAGTDLAVSITGIAGPTGGSAEKPVGLVYIGLADSTGVEVKRFSFGDHLSRCEIRDRSAKAALNVLRLRLGTSS